MVNFFELSTVTYIHRTCKQVYRRRYEKTSRSPNTKLH